MMQYLPSPHLLFFFALDWLVYIFGSYYYFIRPKEQKERPKYWPIRILLATLIISRATDVFTIQLITNILIPYKLSFITSYIVILFVIFASYPLLFKLFQWLLGIRHYVLALALCSTYALITNLTSVLAPDDSIFEDISFLVCAVICFQYKKREFLYLVRHCEAKETIDAGSSCFITLVSVYMTSAFAIGVNMTRIFYDMDQTVLFSVFHIVVALFLLVVCYSYIKAFLQNLIRAIKNDQLQMEVQKADRRIMESQKRMIQSQEKVIEAFANILEEKSGESGGHVRRVAEYTRIICEQLGMTQEEAQQIATASMLHDVGKILIPGEILEKHGLYTPEDMAIMKQHVTYGDQILQNASGDILKTARLIASQHHEYWNGQGYTLGLQGDEIAPAALIVMVADVFDALTSKRCYKPAWSLEAAKQQILSESGTHFSPRVVEAFLAGFDQIKLVHAEYSEA